MTTWLNETKPAINVEYLATEALDFLVTEDNDYLVTEESTIWSNIIKTITSWVNSSK